MAYRSIVCDSVVAYQQKEIILYGKAVISKDSLQKVTEEKFKNEVLLSSAWRGRYENQLNTIGHYKRNADFWKLFGVGCILLSIFISIN